MYLEMFRDWKISKNASRGNRSFVRMLLVLLTFSFLLFSLLNAPVAEAAITFTTGSVVDPSLYQSLVLTVQSNPLTQDPRITTADKLYLVSESESSTQCTTTTSKNTFPITTTSSGGYSGTALLPITTSIVTVGTRYVVCFLSASTGKAFVASRGFVTGSGSVESTSTSMLVYPPLYSQFSLSPTSEMPTAGSGPVGLTVPQVTNAAANRPLNQGLTGSNTIILVPCPSQAICAAGSSDTLVSQCGTTGAAYYQSAVNSGGSPSTVLKDVIALSGLQGQGTTSVYGSFVVPFYPVSSGYIICVPYCATSSCANAQPSFTLVASDNNPSLSLTFGSPNPSFYRRSPSAPQAREEGLITFTGVDLSAQDQVRILASGSSCASTSSSLLPNMVLGTLTLSDSSTSTVSFVMTALLSQQVIGLVCYYHAATQLWSPVYLNPSSNDEPDFTVDVLQPSSFSVVPTNPMLGTTISVYFSGTGLDSTTDKAFLTSSTDSSACTSNSGADGSGSSFLCVMSAGSTGGSAQPVCTTTVNTDANEALELSICYQKGGTTNYAQLAGTVSVAARAPTYTVAPSPVFAGQTVTLSFSGILLSATDRVKLIAPGAACESSSALSGVDLLSTSTVGSYVMVGQASLCLRVCYYLASTSTWIISGPESAQRSTINSVDGGTLCDSNSIYIAPFPLRYRIAVEDSATNGGIGLTVEETTTVSLTIDTTTANMVSLSLSTSIDSLTPVAVKVVQMPDTCATSLCGSAAACSMNQGSSDYVSAVYGSSSHQVDMLVGTVATNYILCAEVSGLDGVFIPVLPSTVTSATALNFGFKAAAINPSVTKLVPQNWRAWMSQYSILFTGKSLSSTTDGLFSLSNNQMLSAPLSSSATSLPVVCPTPQASGSLSTLLTATAVSNSEGSSTSTSFTLSSGHKLFTGQTLYMCYLWTSGTLNRMTYVSAVPVLSASPSSYVWGNQPVSGYRAGNPFTLTLSSNTTTLSANSDTVYFYRFTFRATANACFCSASTCASGTLVDYMETEASETSLSQVNTSAVQYSQAVGFDNYGYAAYYVTCYTRYGEVVDTYLGVLPVGMADPTFYTMSLTDSGSVVRVGAPIRITANNRCRTSDCPLLTTADSLVLVPSSLTCADVEGPSTVGSDVTLVGSPVVDAGGLTFTQTLVVLKEGDYRVCFRSSDENSSGRYSELAAQVGSNSNNFQRQLISVTTANPSAFTSYPLSPSAGQLLTISLTCTSPQCDSCQTLRMVKGKDASCWETVADTSMYTSTDCVSTYSYQFPGVFLAAGSYTICFGDVLTQSRRVPGTLEVGSANPSAYSPSNGESNTIVTDQSTDYYINITGSGLLASKDQVFLLTEKGLTCHDLRNDNWETDSELASWFLPSVTPYPLVGSSTGVQWLVSNRQKRFGAGLLLNSTYCPGDNADCEMQLCYQRAGTSWAPVPLSITQDASIYVVASDPTSAVFDQYPLIVNMYVMVTVTGTGLASTDTLAIYGEACNSGNLVSLSVSGLTPQVSSDGTTWRGVIRLTGTAQTYAVCYTRTDTKQVVEIMMVSLVSSNLATTEETTSNTIIILPSPLFYQLNPSNSTPTTSTSSAMLTLYEEMQVLATFVSDNSASNPLLAVQLIRGDTECNYPPFVTATGSSVRLPVVNVFDVLAGSGNGVSDPIYQGRLYLPGGTGGEYALCMQISDGYFRVTQEASAATSSTSSPYFEVDNAVPASYTYVPSFATIGQTVTLTFSYSRSSGASATSSQLNIGDVVELIDGTLFECGFHNSTMSVAQGLVTETGGSTSAETSTVMLKLPFTSDLQTKSLTVCYRKGDGTFATVPVGPVPDRNFQISVVSPATWTISPLQAVVEQPLSISFYPPANVSTASMPTLTSSDIAFLVEVPSTASANEMTNEAKNALCQTGTAALQSTSLTLDVDSGATRWDIAAMPEAETTYVVCYRAQQNNNYPTYVSSPSTLHLYPRQSPTGAYTNRGVGNDVWQGERFYLFFNTSVELNVELENDVSSGAGTTVDLVRFSPTLDCTSDVAPTYFQTIPDSFGYKPLQLYNSDGVRIPYLHLRVRAAVGKYYVCMKRAKRDPNQVYYDYRVVGGPNFPATIRVQSAPITSFVTVPSTPRAWVPNTVVTTSFTSSSVTIDDFAQLFFVPFTGDYNSVNGGTAELQYDDCYRPPSEDDTISSSYPTISTTLQVTLSNMTTKFPFPNAGVYILCYQLKSSVSTATGEEEVYSIASVYPASTTVLSPSPVSFTTPDLLTVQRPFVMGFHTIDDIFESGLNNVARIYSSPQPNPGEESVPPSCTEGTVPEDSESVFTSFTQVNQTYATVTPDLAEESYYYVCFLTSGQTQSFPLPNSNGGGYYFAVGIHGPQSYSIQPAQPYLGASSSITISGSVLSSDDHVKVVFVNTSEVTPSDYKDLCTVDVPNADVKDTSSSGVQVVPDSGGLHATYRPRLNATGTYVLCYRSMLLDNSWLYVSPLDSFDVQNAHPTSYLQDPIPSYSTAVNTIVIRDGSGMLGEASRSLKLVRRGSGKNGFDCTSSAVQSSLVTLLSYKASESSATYASFSICATAPVSLTVCYLLNVPGNGWAEVPYASPPPSYVFEGAEVVASPFQSAPILNPATPRPFGTFALTILSNDHDVEAMHLSFAYYPQPLCSMDVPYVEPVYYAKSETEDSVFYVSLPKTGSYVVYVGSSPDVSDPNVTLSQPLVVGGCDPCSFSPPYATVDMNVSLLFQSATGDSLSEGDKLHLIPIEQGMDAEACATPMGPFAEVTFTPTSVGIGGSSATFTVFTGSEEEAQTFEGSYYACYRRRSDDGFAVVSNGDGEPDIFSIIPNDSGIVTAESCPESGKIYSLETVTYNLTVKNPERYPVIGFSSGDEMVLLQPDALPASGCEGINEPLSSILSKHPQAVVLPVLESFTDSRSNWYATMLHSDATSYTVCFRLGYTETFYSVTDSPQIVLAANPSTYSVYPPVVLPSTPTFLLTISGNSLLSTDEAFLVAATEGTCMETCYLADNPTDWSGVSIERVSVAPQELQLKVTNLMSSTSLQAVVLRMCYRRTGEFLTELGQIYIGEQNPTSYSVNFVPRVGTRPTLTFTGTKLTSTDRMFIVRDSEYCLSDNARAYGVFLDIDSTTSTSSSPTWTSFYLPLTVGVGSYRVCYVLSTINAGVPVGDALKVQSGGPSSFVTSNVPMVGRATEISFPNTSTSVYAPQIGDSAYIACNGCSCYNEKEATVAYGTTNAAYTNATGNELVSMRVGFSNTMTYPVCYKVYDSGYALVSNLVPQMNSPAAADVYPVPTYQGQRLVYNFSQYTNTFPGIRTDSVMLVTQRRFCWETASADSTDVVVSPSTISALQNGVAEWRAHVPSVGPDTPSVSLFPLAYTLCYRESGQEEYVAVPYPHQTLWWMNTANPASFLTSPARVRAGMIGVVVTFPGAAEGDEVYLVAYNGLSNTDCTDPNAQVLAARGSAYPTYIMDVKGGAPLGDDAGVFCYIKKGATVAEVPQLLAIQSGNPSGYTTNATSSTRFREYLAFTVTGENLSPDDLIAFTESPCGDALPQLSSTTTTTTTTTTTRMPTSTTTTTTTTTTAMPTSTTTTTTASPEGSSRTSSSTQTSSLLYEFDESSPSMSLSLLMSSPLLARLSDLDMTDGGNQVTFVAQFRSEENQPSASKLYLCYAREQVWTEVGEPIILDQPEPATASLYHAYAGSIVDAPLRVGQHLQVQLSGTSTTFALDYAAVIIGDDTNPESWCSNFTGSGVLEPGLRIASPALLDIPLWATTGTSRLCLLPEDAPWVDVGSTPYAPLLPMVFPPNPSSMEIYPITPRVGQQVTFTFHLLVQATNRDVVKLIADEGMATLPCEEAASLSGFADQTLYVTVIDDNTTAVTPIDSTDPMHYRTFNTTGVIRVCYYSATEEIWSVVGYHSTSGETEGEETGAENDEEILDVSVTIYPLAPEKWEVYSGSTIMGQEFQLSFHETGEADVLHPTEDKVWGVPLGKSCAFAIDNPACDDCLNLTIDTTLSGASTVITVLTGSTIVDAFYLCYQLEDATAAVIPNMLTIDNASIQCSITTDVIIGAEQVVTFLKEEDVDVSGDEWRVSFWAADAAIGCEAHYDPDFVPARATQSNVTSTTVSYTLEWPVTMTNETYIICYEHKKVLGPVCTCEQLAAKSGECYIQTQPGSPSSFVATPYPTYVGQEIALTFTLDPEYVAYPPTAIKFVEFVDPLLTTCQGNAAFIPSNAVLSPVSSTTYRYTFQHDYKLGPAKLLVCALTSRTNSYVRVASASENNMLYIRPYMKLSTFPSLPQYIRAMQTISANFTHETDYEDDVVSLNDELYIVTDPYHCTATFIDAQNPQMAMQMLDLYDTAFDTLPAAVSTIDVALKSSSTTVTFNINGTGVFYMCYKLANGGTWAPVLPELEIETAAIDTCVLKKPTGTENGDDVSLRAMQYIATTLVGGDVLGNLANPAVDMVRVVPRSQMCTSSSAEVFEGGVANSSTFGTFTTVAFASSEGKYKLCYRLGGTGSEVANWSPACLDISLTPPTPLGNTTGCFAVRQAIEVEAYQRKSNFKFTSEDTFRFVPGDQPCLLPSLTPVSPSTTITVGDATQEDTGISPSPTDTSTFNLPYALLGAGTTSLRLCYTDFSGNQFAVPLQYSTDPTVSSWTVYKGQPAAIGIQRQVQVGQRVMMNFTSNLNANMPLTPYGPLPDPFEFAPPFNGSFDGASLLAVATGTVYRDGRCMAAVKAAGEGVANPLDLLGVYGPPSSAYTLSAFAPTVPQRYITCYRLANCLVADVGSTVAVLATNPGATTTQPSLPRRGQLITVNFARTVFDSSVAALTPGEDRGIKQANLASCWGLSPDAGSIVEGTTSATFFEAFFPAQPPSKASTTSTTTCYRLAEGSWSSVPNGVADVLPANPSAFSTVPAVARANEGVQLEMNGDGLSVGDKIKILSGSVLNCTDEDQPASSITVYDDQGNPIEGDVVNGWTIANITNSGKGAGIHFASSATGTFSVCYKLNTDSVWTLVYGTLSIMERSPKTMTMTPVSVLETELFTLHFTSASDDDGVGTLRATDRVILYAGSDVNCLNPGDAVSISASPSDVANIPESIDFQIDSGTRGEYTLCYLATVDSTTESSSGSVVRSPIWGFPVINVQPDPVALSVYPIGKDDDLGLGTAKLRAKQIVSLVFKGFGLVATANKSDEVKLINAVDYPSPSDALCRSVQPADTVVSLPLYANGTFAVQQFESTTFSGGTSAGGRYWVCYRLYGGQYHYIGDEVVISQTAMPASATTNKTVPESDEGGSTGSTAVTSAPSSTGFTYYDSEMIEWTISQNLPCRDTDANFLFYSADTCGDIPYYTGAILTEREAAHYFPLGFASVDCSTGAAVPVRIGPSQALKAAFANLTTTSTSLSLCYYYGAPSRSDVDDMTTLPSVSLLGEPNSIPVTYGNPEPLVSPIHVVAMTPFTFTLNVVPAVDDYYVLVTDPNDCVGVTAPNNLALFMVPVELNGALTITAAVPSAGTYYICYSHRVGYCSQKDRECARLVGEIDASAPSPSSWTGYPATVYTTDSYEVSLQFPPKAQEASKRGTVWLSLVDGNTMLDVYQACLKTTEVGEDTDGTIELVLNSSTERWVAQKRFATEGLHAICYVEPSTSTDAGILHLFGPVSYAGPVVQSSEVVSAVWSSTPILVAAQETVVLKGGGLAATDALTAVRFTTASIPSDICSNGAYKSVSANPITGDDSTEVGLSVIERSFLFTDSGVYVLCYRSLSWTSDRSAEVITSLGSFSVLPNIINVTVQSMRQYVDVPLTLLFSGSGIQSSDEAALVFAGDVEGSIDSDLCEGSKATYSALEGVSSTGDTASMTTTPTRTGVYVVCFKGVNPSTGEGETILLSNRITVYAITAVEAVFSIQPACIASRLCQSQPAVQLRTQDGQPASTPDSTIALWLVNENNVPVTAEAGLTGGDTFFLNDAYDTFQYLGVSILKAGTYKMKANVTLPNGVVLIATSSVLSVESSGSTQSVAELQCTPTGIVQNVGDKITCIVTALMTTSPTSYTVAAQPGSATSCEPMDTPSATGLPRCQFVVTPPSTITTNYLVVTATPAAPFTSWPVVGSPSVIRLPRIPDVASTIKCAAPTYSPPLPMSNQVRAGDALSCNVQGIATVNGVAQSIVGAPDRFSVRYYMNNEINRMSVVDMGNYPSGVNGLYTLNVPVERTDAQSVTVVGQVLPSSHTWMAMQGSPQKFVVLGYPSEANTQLRCLSNISGSASFFSPSNVMNCTLTLGNAEGPVLGLLEDYTISMPQGGTVNTITPNTNAQTLLPFTLLAPAQPPAKMDSQTFEFPVQVVFTPNDTQVGYQGFGLVYVSNVLTSPLPDFKIRSTVSLELKGSGLVLTHFYRVSPVDADCASGSAMSPLLVDTTNTLKLTFTVPDASAFYICYRPGDGTAFQPLMTQAFVTGKASEVTWTKANIILLSLGVGFLAILLVLLVILLWRVCCVMKRRKEEESTATPYLPPRMNDRYVYQASVNPVAQAPSLPPLGPAAEPTTVRQTREDVDVTRVHIQVREEKEETNSPGQATSSSPPPPPPPVPPPLPPMPAANGNLPAKPADETRQTNDSLVNSYSSSLPTADARQKHRRKHHHRHHGSSASVQTHTDPLQALPPPPATVSVPAQPLSDALLDPHRQRRRHSNRGSRQSSRTSGPLPEPVEVKPQWSPTEQTVPAPPPPPVSMPPPMASAAPTLESVSPPPQPVSTPSVSTDARLPTTPPPIVDKREETQLVPAAQLPPIVPPPQGAGQEPLNELYPSAVPNVGHTTKPMVRSRSGSHASRTASVL